MSLEWWVQGKERSVIVVRGSQSLEQAQEEAVDEYCSYYPLNDSEKISIKASPTTGINAYKIVIRC